MIKLYKKTAQGTLYWEAWDDGNSSVVIHWGSLGQTGKSKDIPLPKNKSAEEIIDKEKQPQIANGYQEIELTAVIIIKYKCDGFGTKEDLEKRYAVEDFMNEHLGWTGNGHCDGGDIGSGSFSIYCNVVDTKIAAQTTIEALRKEDLLDGATIATKEVFGNLDEKYVVHWPPDYSGEFYGV